MFKLLYSRDISATLPELETEDTWKARYDQIMKDNQNLPKQSTLTWLHAMVKAGASKIIQKFMENHKKDIETLKETVYNSVDQKKILTSHNQLYQFISDTAAEYGQMEILDMILSRNLMFMSTFRKAGQGGHMIIVYKLFSVYKDLYSDVFTPEQYIKHVNTLIHQVTESAALHHQFHLVRWGMENGADVFPRYLNNAIVAKNNEMIRYILEQGKNKIDWTYSFKNGEKDKQTKSVLIVFNAAIKTGNIALIKEFISFGVKVDECNNMMIFLRATSNQLEVTKLFPPKDDKIDIEFSLYAAHNNKEALEYLISLGATDFNTALVVACTEYVGNDSNMAIVQFLIDKGADDYNYLLCSKFDEIFEYGIELKASNFNMALKYAAKYNNIDRIQKLIQLGANNLNEAILEYGVQFQTIKLLCDAGANNYDALLQKILPFNSSTIELPSYSLTLLLPYVPKWDIIEYLLSKGASNYGLVAVNAAVYGQGEWMKRMLEIDPSYRCNVLDTLFQLGHWDLIKKLKLE